jgi:hypothetical protein
MTEIVDYSYYGSRIKYRVNLKNTKEKIIDTTIYKNSHQLPFLIELDLKEAIYNLSSEKENKNYIEFDKRNIRIIDKFDEEFPLWRIFFENTKVHISTTLLRVRPNLSVKNLKESLLGVIHHRKTMGNIKDINIIYIV